VTSQIKAQFVLSRHRIVLLLTVPHAREDDRTPSVQQDVYGPNIIEKTKRPKI